MTGFGQMPTSEAAIPTTRNSLFSRPLHRSQVRKLLVAPDCDSTATRRALIATAAEALNQFQVSSIHMLFTTPEEARLLKENGFHSRTGTVEFIWRNRHYTSMEEFLASLSSKKRKNIRQERSLVSRQGISVEAVSGEEIKAKHWQALENFYNCTVEKYGSIKYLTHEFFRAARDNPCQIASSCFWQKRMDSTLAGLSACKDWNPCMAGTGEQPRNFAHCISRYATTVQLSIVFSKGSCNTMLAFRVNTS